jgi:hypothetical protein
MGYTITKENYPSLSKFLCWLPWWHDKYPDDIRPRSMLLEACWCYHSHIVPYAGFQVLKIVDLNLVDNVLHITPQEKIQWG